VYKRDTCLPAIDESIRADRWRVDSWFDRVEIRFLSLAEVESIDPDGLAFRNVNTPEDLQAAEQLATRLDDSPTS
jgi:molybdopterin-guanine dinucleotide biosynthesis protein A